MNTQYMALWQYLDKFVKQFVFLSYISFSKIKHYNVFFVRLYVPSNQGLLGFYLSSPWSNEILSKISEQYFCLRFGINYLMTTHDNCFGAIIVFKDALHIVTFACRTPVRLFRVIRLHGMLPFHVQGDYEVWAGILIGSR